MGIEQYKRSGPPEETPMTRLSPPAESRPGFSPELVKELARQAQEIEGYNSLTLAGAIRYLTHDIRYGGRGVQGDLERLVKAELQTELQPKLKRNDAQPMTRAGRVAEPRTFKLRSRGNTSGLPRNRPENGYQPED